MVHHLEYRKRSARSDHSEVSSQPLQTDIFIYCHSKDKKHLEKLKIFFKSYTDNDTLNIWDNRSIPVGSDRLQATEQALLSAKVAILLISADFFADDTTVLYILPRLIAAAKQESITLISVILGYCNFENSELAQFQPANGPHRPLIDMKSPEREKIWAQVAQSARDIIAKQNAPIFNRFFDQSDALMHIARLFFQCHSMRHKTSREHVLRQLPQEMRKRIETFPFITQNDNTVDFEEVYHLVNICFSSYTDGLEKLAYALYQSEQASLPWQNLDAYLRSRHAKLVTYTRQQELYDILKSVSWPDYSLSKAYRASVPEGWNTLHNYDAPDKLQLVVNDLANIPLQNDDTFPILEFALRLASIARDKQDASLHDALLTWINGRSSDLGLTVEQQAALQKRVEQKQQPTATYLLLQLDSTSDNTFSIQCWLFDDENNIIPNDIIEVPDTPHALEDIPDLLEDLLDKCDDLLSDTITNLVIEFALPLELLSYPVDHYGLKAPLPLSLRHQIVVRSLQRMKNKKKQMWKAKWERFQHCMKEEQAFSTKSTQSVVYDATHYKGQQAFTATLMDECVTSLALSFVPSHISSPQDDVLAAVVQAGIPVALWPKEQTDYPIALHELLTELVSRSPLSQLPSRIKEQRRLAIASGDMQHHQGHHLTLLWDDPNRLPYYRPLVRPSASRGA